MSEQAFIETSLSQRVALGRLQARQGHASSSPSAEQATADSGDTVPMWFRSEAFAEDVQHSPDSRAAPPGHAWVQDSQLLAAGAAVLRQTMAALKLKRW